MVTSVKNELISWIQNLEDEKMLDMLKHIKDNKGSEKDWYLDLTEQEKKSIEKGRKDHKKGNSLSSQEFWDKHDL